MEQRVIDQAEWRAAIENWLKLEGGSVEFHASSDGAVGATIQYPSHRGTRLRCVREGDRGATILSISIGLGDAHAAGVGKLEALAAQRLRRDLRRVGFAGGEIGFALRDSGQSMAGWRLEAIIYDSGFNQDRFMVALRRVSAKNLELLEVLKMHLDDVP